MQQVFLYLTARNAFPSIPRAPVKTGGGMLNRHKQVARFLAGFHPPVLTERAILLVMAISAFGHEASIERIIAAGISPEFLRILTEIAPEIAANIWARISNDSTNEQKTVARTQGLYTTGEAAPGESTLAALAQPGTNPFYEEENLLILAEKLLEIPFSDWPEHPEPWLVMCRLKEPPDGRYFGLIDPKSISFSEKAPRALHLFQTPDWCEDDADKQRQQLGMLLRYSIRATINFHASAAKRTETVLKKYRTPTSHWEQQRYSGYQGRSAFGPDWLPISSATEAILFELLRWPGCGVSTPVKSIQEIDERIRTVLSQLRHARGAATKATFLKQSSPLPGKPPSNTWERPLRVGIVQSITPNFEDYEARLLNPELVADPPFRLRQRRHLAAMIEGVAQMLRVRETHRTQKRQDGRALDLLVFPELSVHPLDIERLVIPFVRTHKCMVLCGLVYHSERSLPGAPLINSCLWLIPEWSRSAGFQIRRFEQGKQHLTDPEKAFTPAPVGFRPAQWLVEYQWHSSAEYRPLIISASVCYDATDLALASDLKSKSDFWVVCALNKDVGTFDRMAEGLHYHMFQPVMIVNNGQFGGSSLFAPFQANHHRQVLHLHGQPQAMIAFAELSPRKIINRPDQNAEYPAGEWKTRPAGSK